MYVHTILVYEEIGSLGMRELSQAPQAGLVGSEFAQDKSFERRTYTFASVGSAIRRWKPRSMRYRCILPVSSIPFAVLFSALPPTTGRPTRTCISLWTLIVLIGVRSMKLRSGDIIASAHDFPSYLWLKGKYDSKDMFLHFLKGETLVLVSIEHRISRCSADKSS